MVKPEDAQNLAGSTELFIRQQKLTASVAKVLLKSIRTCRSVIYVQLKVLFLYYRNLRGNYLQMLPTGWSR